MTRVLVVGGGASGRLVALHLLGRAPAGAGLRVQVVDRGGPDHMGPAYSTSSDALLLNVPAEIMGVSSDDPEEFHRWAADRGAPSDPKAFLPRRLFRAYFMDRLEAAIRAHPDDEAFEHIQAEATDITVNDEGAEVHLADGRRLPADRVVLALGNFPPPTLPMSDPATRESHRFAAVPWDLSIFDRLDPDDPILFIGTGQTMVDLCLELTGRGHRGPLTGISRRGLLPLTHPEGHETYPSFFPEIEGETRIRRVLAVVRRHVRKAEAAGIDPRAVIDSMRSHTQALWAGIPEVEKRRFMRHVFRYWERIRSRIPPGSGRVIRALRDQGRLRIVAGRVREMVDTGTEMEVRYSPRNGGPQRADRTERAALVVSCIGPETDFRRVRDPLVRNLMDRGLMRPGMANIGMATDLEGAVLDADGRASNVLFTLGSTMKGLVWEMLAVPDIRVQAEKLAERFVAAG